MIPKIQVNPTRFNLPQIRSLAWSFPFKKPGSTYHRYLHTQSSGRISKSELLAICMERPLDRASRFKRGKAHQSCNRRFIGGVRTRDLVAELSFRDRRCVSGWLSRVDVRRFETRNFSSAYVPGGFVVATAEREEDAKLRETARATGSRKK